MKKGTVFLFLILPLFLLSSSCTKIVRDEFGDFEKKPVINSIVIDSMPIQVYVSMTKKLDATPLVGFDLAVVKLFEDDQFKETLPSIGKGLYKSSLLAKQGKEYTLEVDIKDFGKKILKVKTPKKNRILNIEHINKAGVTADGTSCPAFKITFTTDPTKKEYFQIIESGI